MERWQPRRSKRLHLQIRVRVFGVRPKTGSFREDTQTLNVSANGTLLPLKTPLEPGQTIVLRNRLTGEDQECRVAFVGPVSEGMTRVGLAFRHPAPQFWQVDFPPLDPNRVVAVPARTATAGSTPRR